MSNSAIKVAPINPEKWDSSLNDILDDMNGRPIKVHQLMANNPSLLKAWWNFRNYSVEGGALGKRKGELVILRVAVHMQAWYEWGSHVDRSLACGLSLEEINRTLDSQTNQYWSEEEAVLLTAVDELIADKQISPTTLAVLSAHYDTAQIMDIMAIQGMYIILACMIKTWGLELDEAVAKRIKGQTTKEFFKKHAADF